MIKPRLWRGGARAVTGMSHRITSGEDNYFTSSTNYGGLAFYSDYAHSDWLQFAMEFGVVGASLMLAILIYWFGYAVWLGRRLRAEGWVVLLAAAALLAHATIDFPLYNTAVLALFCVLVASTIKPASLESRFGTHR